LSSSEPRAQEHTSNNRSSMSLSGEPLVTAVIPVYNHENYVAQSIRSVIDQTYRNVELIVVDDGSKDRSHEVILAMTEEARRRFTRFEYIHQQNMGLSATLNKILAMARGEYFSILASDDAALPEKFSLLVKTLQEKGSRYVAAFGNALLIDGAGDRISLTGDSEPVSHGSEGACDNFLDFYSHGKLRLVDVDYRSDEFGSYSSLVIGNYLPAMSNVVRTQPLREAGGWTPGNIIEDWEMWLKLAKNYRFVYVDEPVALYRWHVSNTIKSMPKAAKLACLSLVSREQDFCFRRGLVALWGEAYFRFLSPVFEEKSISMREKLSTLDLFALLRIAPSFIGSRIAARISGRTHPSAVS
jgi:alpha-1,3-rhamnosyltransferase